MRRQTVEVIGLGAIRTQSKNAYEYKNSQSPLSKGGFHQRLSGGGIGVVNLAHLAGYTVYPGVAQVPLDTWRVESVFNES